MSEEPAVAKVSPALSYTTEKVFPQSVETFTTNSSLNPG